MAEAKRPTHPLALVHPRSLTYLSDYLQALVRGRLWLKVLAGMVLGLATPAAPGSAQPRQPGSVIACQGGGKMKLRVDAGASGVTLQISFIRGQIGEHRPVPPGVCVHTDRGILETEPAVLRATFRNARASLVLSADGRLEKLVTRGAKRERQAIRYLVDGVLQSHIFHVHAHKATDPSGAPVFVVTRVGR